MVKTLPFFGFDLGRQILSPGHWAGCILTTLSANAAGNVGFTRLTALASFISVAALGRRSNRGLGREGQ